MYLYLYLLVVHILCTSVNIQYGRLVIFRELIVEIVMYQAWFANRSVSDKHYLNRLLFLMNYVPGLDRLIFLFFLIFLNFLDLFNYLCLIEITLLSLLFNSYHPPVTGFLGIKAEGELFTPLNIIFPVVISGLEVQGWFSIASLLWLFYIFYACQLESTHESVVVILIFRVIVPLELKFCKA